MENRPVPLLLIALPVFLIFLGANSIWDANEAFYVETPRQMVLTGDYVTPMFNGTERLNKPVLSYWIVAGLYHLFGISVGVERLAIAVAGLAMVLSAFLIGRALRSSATGVWAALIVATAPRVVFFSRRILIDVGLTAFMSLALACFVLAERHPEQRRRWLLLMYVALGLGVLTKGPVALVLPALTCVIWLAWERRLSDFKRLLILPGLLIVGAIVVPWIVAVTLRWGADPFWAFIGVENLERYRTAMTGERPFWFLLSVLFADLLMPWAPLLLVPMATAWRRVPSTIGDASAPIRRLLWIWIAVIVAFFSTSASKEDLYVLPVVAAAAALIAEALVRSGFGRTSLAVRTIFGAVCLLCLALAVLVATTLRSGPYAIADAWIVSAVLGIAAVGGLALLIARRYPAAVVTFAAAFVVFNYLLVARLLPHAESTKPVPPIAAVLKARASPESRLGTLNMMLPSLVYYANRSMTEVSVDEAATWLASTDEVWILTGGEEWDALRPRAPSACVAAKRTLFPFDRVRVASLFNQSPPPDVVLVTNKCPPSLASRATARQAAGGADLPRRGRP